MRFFCLFTLLSATILFSSLHSVQAESAVKENRTDLCKGVDLGSKLSEHPTCLVERLAATETLGLFSVLEMCGAVPENETAFWTALEDRGWRPRSRNSTNAFLTNALATTPEEIAFITFILKGQSFENEREIPPLENYMKVGDDAVSAMLDGGWNGIFVINKTDLLVINISYDHTSPDDGPHSIRCDYSGKETSTDYEALRVLMEVTAIDSKELIHNSQWFGAESLHEKYRSVVQLGIYSHRPLSKYLNKAEVDRSFMSIETTWTN